MKATAEEVAAGHKSIIPPRLNSSDVRFYVAQYNEDDGEYYALHCLQSDGFWKVWLDTLDAAMEEACAHFATGDFVHCIYEVSREGTKRHNFDPDNVGKLAGADDYVDYGSW